MAGTHPLAGVEGFWDEVIADMEATAEEYREAGWETLELHPGDVTPLPTATAEVEADRTGLDVLLPGDEFRELEDLVEEATFDEYDAYRAEEGDVVFLVLAMRAEDRGLAVVFPLYYARRVAEPMLRRVAERGELRTFLRPLDDSRRVVFSQRDPAKLLPTGFEEGEADDRGPDGDDAEEDAGGGTRADEE